MASVAEELEEEWGFPYSLFGPLFFPRPTAEEELHLQRLREKKEKEEKEEKARRQEEVRRSWEVHGAVLESIREYNHKEKCILFTRFFMKDFSRFDINEESPIPPMRFTHKEYGKNCLLLFSANILSVKIASSDVGFPINVYGTVIVRDNLDKKCIHVFRRHRDDCQLIKSKDDSLILTGPARGLLLTDYLYIELDLKIKGDQRNRADRELSRGLLDIDGRILKRYREPKVESTTLDSWLSTVQVEYAIVKDAMEATVEFKLVKGDFSGTIKAKTASIEREIVLYDAETSGVVICDGSGGGAAIKLQRRVISVSLRDKLIFEVKVSDDGDATAAKRTVVQFTASVNGEDNDVVCVGGNVFDVKVSWSWIDCR